MSDEQRRAGRLDRAVGRLLAGRRLDAGRADASEREEIQMAARLAGAREAYPRMSPAFRRRLGARLERSRPGAGLTRRTALVAGLSAAFGGLLGAGLARFGVAGGEAGPARPALAGVPGAIVPRPGRWFDAGPLAAFAEGQAVRFQAGAVGAYLVRRGTEVHAMSSICTHLPCELSWEAARSELKCPCHNLAFDTEGASLVGPDSYPLPPLPRLQVRVVGGMVQVLGA